jgi:hypothetical protein
MDQLRWAQRRFKVTIKAPMAAKAIPTSARGSEVLPVRGKVAGRVAGTTVVPATEELGATVVGATVGATLVVVVVAAIVVVVVVVSATVVVVVGGVGTSVEL